MGASLNELAETLAEREGRQFDDPFKDELKIIINYWRSRLLRDSVERDRKDRALFTQYFEVPLVEVLVSELPGLPEMRIMRTKCQLPIPLRANGILFDYIGSPDKISAFKLFSEQHLVRSALDGPLTGHKPKGLWLNNYIYIFNSSGLPAIGVRSIFDDIQQLNDTLCGCGCQACYNDDDPYPVSGDLQQRIIQSILSTELRSKVSPDTKTIPEDGIKET